ncbi:hypothetical protein BT63DRAFT_455542 [Microthyrium microscopicum]|uniref:Uncharacterized protein n=1 Tax=Microthyrium microscopicum TaxID=703497 RepID=A0A6A6UDT6_9PEZI|nr:hypothetical protein BT63DRAFT_455542 [Microthyrium microscopicum]
MHFINSLLVTLALGSSALAYPSAPVATIIHESAASDTTAYTQLEKRDDRQVLGCLRAINTNGLSGSYGERQWNDVHGDNKSKSECWVDGVKTKGSYNLQAIHDSDGKYRFQILGGKNALKSVEVGRCKDNKAPTLGRGVHFLRKAYGGEAPPAC